MHGLGSSVERSARSSNERESSERWMGPLPATLPLPETKSPSGLFTHLKAALANFRSVASLLPSTESASRSIARRIDADDRAVVEFGAGIGNLTRAILERISPNGRFVAVEVEKRFAPLLESISDPRLRLIFGDLMEFLPRLPQAFPDGVDAVVAGIPFSFLSAEARETIVKVASENLRPGGKIVLYQHSRLMMPLLYKYCREARCRLEFRGLFPYWVMTGTA
jgi:phospholipid N-methyltransferase